MTRGKRATYTSGRRRLMRRMVNEGIIAEGALFQPARPGQGDREIDIVIARLIRALRRENLGGRQQVIADVLRVLRRKKARHLHQTTEGLVLRDLLRALRKLPGVLRAAERTFNRAAGTRR